MSLVQPDTHRTTPGQARDPLERSFYAILSQVPAEDPDREGLLDTPRRAAAAVQDLTAGYSVDIAGLFTTFDAAGYDELVTVRSIPVYSLCEHHLLPFVGFAHVSYIPDGRIVGLSKIARVVDAFARRLQVQERMTVQIADAIEQHLRPRGLLVEIEAEHFCMAMRGVQAPRTMTGTTAARGDLRDRRAALTTTVEREAGHR
ncbi:GTP cyclohydrolase I FolE [Kribbella sp. NPDC058245]|uniref:GTP cyclohydrolase I FolE n=1 Tax=Kribbella sp. NPDC058245 TaxID=3346399 RepID=UPI0036E8A659